MTGETPGGPADEPSTLPTASETEKQTAPKPRGKIDLAPVKKEFVLDYAPNAGHCYSKSEGKRFEKLQNPDEARNNKRKRGLEEAKSGDAGPPKKRIRGMQTGRKKKNSMPHRTGFCKQWGMAGNNCSYGDKCKFSHDVEAYMTKKGPDIPLDCPNFKRFKWCKYGLMCRAGECHIEKTEAKSDEGVVTTSHRYSGELDKDLKFQAELDQEYLNNPPNMRQMITSLKRSKKWAKARNKPNKQQDWEKYKELYGIAVPLHDDFKCAQRLRTVLQRFQGQDTDTKQAKYTEFREIVLKGEPLLDLEGNNLLKQEKNLRTFPKHSGNPCFMPLNALELPKALWESKDTPAQTKFFPMLERRKLDFKGKTYLAPLTTVGNLPFRRLCTDLQCDITCGEMAMGDNLLKGMGSEWALLRRHKSEKFFGTQIALNKIERVLRTGAIIDKFASDLDFIDLNCGCPLDHVCNMGSGAGLMQKPNRMSEVLRSLHAVTSTPITVKMRMGFYNKDPNAKEIIQILKNDGVSAVTVHGRSRQQRYRREADWKYLRELAEGGRGMALPIIGNGDIFTYEEYYDRLKSGPFDTLMIGRGALIKPWLFTEIKERRHWDISGSERLGHIKDFCNYGLQYWGSDGYGVAKTRKFLLEWMSFTCRYIPLGILERPVKINECPPLYIGRNDTETLLSSKNVDDWIKVSEMFLGKAQDGFRFVPKHKASSYKTSADEINELGQLIRNGENAIVK